MTQCHDVYDPSQGVTRPLTVVSDGGVGCHDAYPVDGTVAPPEHYCTVHESRHGEVRVLRLEGRLDWASAPAFRQYLDGASRDPGVVIDLTGAAVDAAGTGAVLAAAADVRRRHHHLAVVTAEGPEADALVDAGLGDVAGVAGDERAALDWLRQRGVDVGPASRRPQRS